jgi:hypothetical protein
MTPEQKAEQRRALLAEADPTPLPAPEREQPRVVALDEPSAYLAQRLDAVDRAIDSLIAVTQAHALNVANLEARSADIDRAFSDLAARIAAVESVAGSLHAAFTPAAPGVVES